MLYIQEKCVFISLSGPDLLVLECAFAASRREIIISIEFAVDYP